MSRFRPSALARSLRPALAGLGMLLAAGGSVLAQSATPAPVPDATTDATPGAVALLNDYPTEARAEYVFSCMAVNGQTQDALRRCSCSVDTIATILPYDDYVSAETVLRMRLGGGERGAMFRGAPAMRAIVADLRRAQAEAEMLCF